MSLFVLVDGQRLHIDFLVDLPVVVVVVGLEIALDVWFGASMLA